MTRDYELIQHMPAQFFRCCASKQRTPCLVRRIPEPWHLSFGVHQPKYRYKYKWLTKRCGWFDVHEHIINLSYYKIPLYDINMQLTVIIELKF